MTDEELPSVSVDVPPASLAHQHSSIHRTELERSAVIGCFYCLSFIDFNEITEWVDGGKTALCPHCGIDAVIGDQSTYPITTEFLKEMQDYWFNRGVSYSKDEEGNVVAEYWDGLGDK